MSRASLACRRCRRLCRQDAGMTASDGRRVLPEPPAAALIPFLTRPAPRGPYRRSEAEGCCEEGLVQRPSQQTGLPCDITFLPFSGAAAMFALMRVMKMGYLVGLGMLTLVLAWPGNSDAQ